MPEQRKPTRRASEQERRRDLIHATQECVFQGGIRAATVRKIAAIAGVTPGLIRHYFPSKEALLRAAYHTTMDDMTRASRQPPDDDGGAVEQLDAFIARVLSPPVMSPRQHQLWASFTSMAGSLPELGEVHRESYLDFRQGCAERVEAVLLDRGETVGPRQLEHYAIALNALIDGLWLEGCLAGELFAEGELAEIGVQSAHQLLNIATD